MTKRRVMPGMIRERVTERERALIADAHSILRFSVLPSGNCKT